MISFAKIMRQVLTERMSFKQLLDNSEEGRKERGRTDVNVRPLKVTTIDGNEAWTFSYKSNPSTTGIRWKGYVSFFKDDVSNKDNAEDLDCKVSCNCPDYTYRYAYNNNKADAGDLGWNNGRPPRPREVGGVGDYGNGMCKHLCALAEYLRTNITSDAPDPDNPEDIEPIKNPKLKKQPSINNNPTSDAPDPDDYSDTRSGGNNLQEGNNKRLYNIINNLIKSNPEFELYYED